MLEPEVGWAGLEFAFGSLLTDAESLQWIPVAPGESIKPLRFLSGNRGWVLLLRRDRGSYRPSGIGSPTRAHLPC
jgi:hypothetical protein